jgi:hypothetical protein
VRDAKDGDRAEEKETDGGADACEHRVLAFVVSCTIVQRALLPWSNDA